MPPARGFAHLGIVLHTPQRARTYVPWHELTVLVRQPGGSNRRVQNSTKVGKTSSRWHVRRRAPRDDVGAAGVAAACKLALLPRDQWMDAASNSQRFHSDRGRPREASGAPAQASGGPHGPPQLAGTLGWFISGFLVA